MCAQDVSTHLILLFSQGEALYSAHLRFARALNFHRRRRLNARHTHTPKSGMSSQQLPPCFYSAVAASLQPSSADCGSSSGIGSSLAAFSSPSFSSSSFPLSSGTESSISASITSGCGGEEDTDCCPSWVETWRTSASGGRSRNGRARRRRGPSAAKKKQKNAQEKERVKKVREEYDALGAVLESRVEKGSGHFNKVRTLAAAIRYIRELQEAMLQQQTVEQTTTQESGTVGVEPSPLPPPPPPQNWDGLEVDLHQQATNTSLDGFFQEEIVPTYTEVAPDDLPPAYFSYNSVATNSQCLLEVYSVHQHGEGELIDKETIETQ